MANGTGAQRDSAFKHRDSLLEAAFRVVEGIGRRVRSTGGVVTLVILVLLIAFAVVIAIGLQKQPASAMLRNAGGQHGTGPSISPRRSIETLSRMSSKPARSATPLLHTPDSIGPPRHNFPPPDSGRDLGGDKHGTRTPPAENLPSQLDAYFCPDLIVPENCECILRVPVQPLSQGQFDVTDLNDNVVLRVAPRRGGRRAPGSAVSLRGRDVGSASDTADETAQRIVVTTGYGNVLAQCGLAPGTRGRTAECLLLRASGDCFAKIARGEGERFTLRTHTGTRLHFWGAFRQHAVNVTDDAGKLLATTELAVGSEPAIYKLRVAPLMDVGLVLCGLLSIEHLVY